MKKNLRFLCDVAMAGVTVLVISLAVWTARDTEFWFAPLPVLAVAAWARIGEYRRNEQP